jgi:hypothetical protein
MHFSSSFTRVFFALDVEHYNQFLEISDNEKQNLLQLDVCGVNCMPDRLTWSAVVITVKW